jgi:hypothetical protein
VSTLMNNGPRLSAKGGLCTVNQIGPQSLGAEML